MSAVTSQDTSAAPKGQRDLTPLFLVGPSTLLFFALVLLPLGLTVLLSFNSYSYDKGIENVYTLANYTQVLKDPYYLSIFWRTLKLALITTVITVHDRCARGLYPVADARSLALGLPPGDHRAASGLGGRPRFRLEHAAGLAPDS
jgi:hypothetical protein